MAQDPSTARRSEKLTLLLQSLEGYILEVAKTNHGAKPGQIITLVKNTLDRSMLANIDYHEGIAEMHQRDGDIALSAFHKLQADIYKAIIAK